MAKDDYHLPYIRLKKYLYDHLKSCNAAAKRIENTAVTFTQDEVDAMVSESVTKAMSELSFIS
ncbi:hypothetical protein [Pseudolactococcus insecticola]|uniref:Uncharacterized protein n=1 Tax=Pseudolactococcus insecticola TaxID=2709158 RepID=A0A6A0B8F9_9LACT|nr:hypothetical protein [Lactococcus insecticola]GFH40711.1 hypothetical protein Hs20B_11090 [Lactococcus insecticola]